MDKIINRLEEIVNSQPFKVRDSLRQFIRELKEIKKAHDLKSKAEGNVPVGIPNAEAAE